MPTICPRLDYLKDKLGAPTAIGEKIVEVQKLWRDIYNLAGLSRPTASNGTGCSRTATRFRSANCRRA